MKEVHIIGGGESLKKDYWINDKWDFSYFKDLETIAVNYSVNHIPNCKILVGLDTNFHISNKTFLMKWEGTMYAQSSTLRGYPYIKYEVLKRKHSWSTELPYVYSINNSGLAAINLAFILGYELVHLHGFDMKGNNSFYSYKDVNEVQRYFKRICYDWKQGTKQYNLNIINHNPKSSLR